MRFLSVLACLLLALPAAAGDKLQPIPSLAGPVMDLTNTLSADQRQQLSQKLLSLHQKYGAQMQVLVIPTSAPEDAFSYSMRVVEKWKLGTAEKDDGLLLFIAKNDRRSQIQVGYGLEGVIPDAIASRLQNDVMAPYFKQGDFYGGINAVIDGVYARVSGDVSPAQTPLPSAKLSADSVMLFAFLVFATLHTLKGLLGRTVAAVIGAPLGILAGWLMVGMPILAALTMVVILSVVALAPAIGGTPGRGYRSGGWGGGGHSGGFGGGGGGWSGGGGGFGGGGAGGRW